MPFLFCLLKIQPISLSNIIPERNPRISHSKFDFSLFFKVNPLLHRKADGLGNDNLKPMILMSTTFFSSITTSTYKLMSRKSCRLGALDLHLVTLPASLSFRRQFLSGLLQLTESSSHVKSFGRCCNLNNNLSLRLINHLLRNNL
jgi:hypothetical protein